MLFSWLIVKLFVAYRSMTTVVRYPFTGKKTREGAWMFCSEALLIIQNVVLCFLTSTIT